MKPLVEGVYADTTAHIQDIRPDVVVYHPKILTAATATHAVGGIAVMAEMVPITTPTSEFAPPGILSSLPSSWNKSSYGVIAARMAAFSSPRKKLAKDLGVIRTGHDLSLVPVSPTLITPPADWPKDTVMTGQWFIPEREELDEQLRAFLEFGPVLYAGFGSMRDSRGLARAHAIVSAARSVGMKTLLVTGSGGLVAAKEHTLASDVLVRETVAHTTVLPHVDVALHHGGAGTVHAMVRAGVPSVIMPFLGDQPWWAQRLHAMHLGPPALSRNTTRYQTIANSLVQARSYSDVVNVAALTMATEDGLARAVEIIESAEAGIHPLKPA
jgi:sterol 3beta-glucosyltransferase